MFVDLHVHQEVIFLMFLDLLSCHTNSSYTQLHSDRLSNVLMICVIDVFT